MVDRSNTPSFKSQAMTFAKFGALIGGGWLALKMYGCAVNTYHSALDTINSVNNAIPGHVPSAPVIALGAYLSLMAIAASASLVRNVKISNSGVKPEEEPRRDLWGFSRPTIGNADVYENNVVSNRIKVAEGFTMHSFGLPLLSRALYRKKGTVSTLLQNHDFNLDSIRTGQDNTVSVPINLQYRITDPAKFMYKADSPDETIKALRKKIDQDIRLGIRHIPDEVLFGKISLEEFLDKTDETLDQVFSEFEERYNQDDIFDADYEEVMSSNGHSVDPKASSRNDTSGTTLLGAPDDEVIGLPLPDGYDERSGKGGGADTHTSDDAQDAEYTIKEYVEREEEKASKGPKTKSGFFSKFKFGSFNKLKGLFNSRSGNKKTAGIAPIDCYFMMKDSLESIQKKATEFGITIDSILSDNPLPEEIEQRTKAAENIRKGWIKEVEKEIKDLEKSTFERVLNETTSDDPNIDATTARKIARKITRETVEKHWTERRDEIKLYLFAGISSAGGEGKGPGFAYGMGDLFGKGNQRAGQTGSQFNEPGPNP